MTATEKKKVPIKEGLWTTPTTPDEQPQLIGSKCPSCGQVYFPKREKPICIRCQHKGLNEIKLSRKGTIYSFSVIMQAPTAYYIGKVPYAYGVIRLPEGVSVRTHFTGIDFKDLKLNMPVELVIEKLGEDEQGNEVMAHKFKPVSA